MWYRSHSSFVLLQFFFYYSKINHFFSKSLKTNNSCVGFKSGTDRCGCTTNYILQFRFICLYVSYLFPSFFLLFFFPFKRWSRHPNRIPIPIPIPIPNPRTPWPPDGPGWMPRRVVRPCGPSPLRVVGPSPLCANIYLQNIQQKKKMPINK